MAKVVMDPETGLPVLDTTRLKSGSSLSKASSNRSGRGGRRLRKIAFDVTAEQRVVNAFSPTEKDGREGEDNTTEQNSPVSRQSIRDKAQSASIRKRATSIKQKVANLAEDPASPITGQTDTSVTAKSPRRGSQINGTNTTDKRARGGSAVISDTSKGPGSPQITSLSTLTTLLKASPRRKGLKTKSSPSNSPRQEPPGSPIIHAGITTWKYFQYSEKEYYYPDGCKDREVVWMLVRDPKGERNYYYNKTTKSTAWKLPDLMGEAGVAPSPFAHDQELDALSVGRSTPPPPSEGGTATTSSRHASISSAKPLPPRHNVPAPTIPSRSSTPTSGGNSDVPPSPPTRPDKTTERLKRESREGSRASCDTVTPPPLNLSAVKFFDDSHPSPTPAGLVQQQSEQSSTNEGKAQPTSARSTGKSVVGAQPAPRSFAVDPTDEEEGEEPAPPSLGQQQLALANAPPKPTNLTPKGAFVSAPKAMQPPTKPHQSDNEDDSWKVALPGSARETDNLKHTKTEQMRQQLESQEKQIKEMADQIERMKFERKTSVISLGTPGVIQEAFQFPTTSTPVFTPRSNTSTTSGSGTSSLNPPTVSYASPPGGTSSESTMSPANAVPITPLSSPTTATPTTAPPTHLAETGDTKHSQQQQQQASHDVDNTDGIIVSPPTPPEGHHPLESRSPEVEVPTTTTTPTADAPIGEGTLVEADEVVGEEQEENNNQQQHGDMVDDQDHSDHSLEIEDIEEFRRKELERREVEKAKKEIERTHLSDMPSFWSAQFPPAGVPTWLQQPPTTLWPASHVLPVSARFAVQAGTSSASLYADSLPSSARRHSDRSQSTHGRNSFSASTSKTVPIPKESEWDEYEEDESYSSATLFDTESQSMEELNKSGSRRSPPPPGVPPLKNLPISGQYTSKGAEREAHQSPEVTERMKESIPYMSALSASVPFTRTELKAEQKKLQQEEVLKALSRQRNLYNQFVANKEKQIDKERAEQNKQTSKQIVELQNRLTELYQEAAQLEYNPTKFPQSPRNLDKLINRNIDCTDAVNTEQRLQQQDEVNKEIAVLRGELQQLHIQLGVNGSQKLAPTNASYRPATACARPSLPVYKRKQKPHSPKTALKVDPNDVVFHC